MLQHSLKSLVKTTAVYGLHRSGLTRAANTMLGVAVVILALHEIHDDPDGELWTGCPTVFLEKFIRWLRKTGWEIVTLGQARERLHQNIRTQRFVVLTFDDGYQDTLSRAVPILQREQAPFTIFVPSGAITRELFAWWLGLRELFRVNEKVEIATMGRCFSCADLPSKMRSLATASRWVHKNYQCIPDLRETFLTYGVSLDALCDRYFMNEDELRFLPREPLASIGAHTVTHPALSLLNPADALREMVDNRAYLQNCSGVEVADLAYPFGNPFACGFREARLAAQAGFRTAATTSNRPLLVRDEYDFFMLPRVSIHPHWTLVHLDAAINGLTVAGVRNFFGASQCSRLQSAALA
jgi:peptidoglycan/xylan/chitin deacetylase (PgdA/CDA1 family)